MGNPILQCIAVACTDARGQQDNLIIVPIRASTRNEYRRPRNIGHLNDPVAFLGQALNGNIVGLITAYDSLPALVKTKMPAMFQKLNVPYVVMRCMFKKVPQSF